MQKINSEKKATGRVQGTIYKFCVAETLSLQMKKFSQKPMKAQVGKDFEEPMTAQVGKGFEEVYVQLPNLVNKLKMCEVWNI